MTSRAAKRAATDARILEAWGEIDAEYPDKSTPWVASMVADRCNVEYDRVFDALSREAKANGQIPDAS